MIEIEFGESINSLQIFNKQNLIIFIKKYNSILNSFSVLKNIYYQYLNNNCKKT